MKNLLVAIQIMFLSLFKSKNAAENYTSLPLNLQFFAEPGESGKGEPGGTETNPDPGKQDPPADTKQNEHMIPKSRFDEINNNYKAVKDQLDELVKEKEAADRKAKEQQGEYQSLYEQANQQLETFKSDFESAKSRTEALEGVMTSMLNTKMESISEEFHDLIPDNLSPEQKLDWISKAEAKGLFKDKSQDPVGGATNPSGGKPDFDNMSTTQLLKFGYGNKK